MSYGIQRFVLHIYQKLLTGFDMVGLFANMSLQSYFFYIVLDWKSLREYPISAGVPPGPFIDLILSCTKLRSL